MIACCFAVTTNSDYHLVRNLRNQHFAKKDSDPGLSTVSPENYDNCLD